MRARLALVALALLVALEVGAVWVLVSVASPAPVDWGDPLGWLRRTDPETATLVVGRLLGLVVAGWLLATTLLSVVARAVLAVGRVPRALGRALGAVAALSPALLRRLVEAAFAAGTVAAVVASPVAAGPARRPVPAEARPLVAPLAPVRDGRAVVPPAPAPGPDPAASPALAVSPTPAAAGTAPHADAPGDATWRVAPGEHLWAVAEAVVAASGTDDAQAVERYWRRLCEANVDRLASGDPDVVYPGEDLDLPPVA